MQPVQYLKGDARKLDEIIETLKDDLEHHIRHMVEKFGGFKLTVEDAPTRADDEHNGRHLESGGAVRITIRPKFRNR
jgi:hypothetical protein